MLIVTMLNRYVIILPTGRSNKWVDTSLVSDESCCNIWADMCGHVGTCTRWLWPAVEGNAVYCPCLRAQTTYLTVGYVRKLLLRVSLSTPTLEYTVRPSVFPNLLVLNNKTLSLCVKTPWWQYPIRNLGFLSMISPTIMS